jgi:formamidopyrimidine-DNA glycosylase
MPELPEVETIARGVQERIAGERIVSTWFSGKKEPMKSPVAEMAEVLDGAKIDRVHRIGKHIVVDFARKGKTFAQWIVHLGMSGRLLVNDADVPQPLHTHAELALSNGKLLRFVDPRRFGRLSVISFNKDESGFTGPGREPLTISENEFVALFRGRKTSIKAALLDQSLLHGVGNIYADECLFRAGIRPRTRAGKLTKSQLSQLRKALQLVLREAIKLGGSTVSDYVDAAGVEGFFQLRHRVYQRTGEPCLVCKTPVKRITLAGRSTHYCSKCQK